MNQPKFKGGLNIAVKIPKAFFDQTIRFYRDVLGLPVEEEQGEGVARSYSCRFGQGRLWFDLVENYSQADIWLELETNDLAAATRHLEAQGVPIRDELEPLPSDLRAHWISSPAGTIHLLREKGHA